MKFPTELASAGRKSYCDMHYESVYTLYRSRYTWTGLGFCMRDSKNMCIRHYAFEAKRHLSCMLFDQCYDESGGAAGHPELHVKMLTISMCGLAGHIACNVSRNRAFWEAVLYVR